MTIEFRPLGVWTEGTTRDRRSRSTFKASWSDTLRLLDSELGHLNARQVVIQIDVIETDIRNDGLPRATARPGHPGARVAFESKYGPLTYATDTHEFWQHNVRAIALGLQALRAVDRYGVTKRGEQYTGWKQLPSGVIPAPTEMTRLVAQDRIAYWASVGLARDLPTDPDELARCFRKARGEAHPDRSGDSAGFLELEQAGRVLGLIT